MSWKAARWTEPVLVLLLFSFLFFLVRAPLFSLGWDGQDGSGHDADIFIHQPAKPNYLLFGRLNGKEIYFNASGHPGPLYAMYGAMGRILQHAVNYDALSNLQIIRMLKIIASLFQLAIWFPLLWLIARSLSNRTARIIGYSAISALALSPIAIQSSNEFQIDSMFGFVMAGAYALSLLAFDRRLVPPPVSIVFIAVAAAFVGLGKNEWTLVLALACFGTLVLTWFVDRIGYLEDGQWHRLATCLLPTLGGLVLGNLASYLFEPALYTSGWALLTDMVGKASIADEAGRARFIEVNAARRTFIQVHLLLLVFVASRMITSWRVSPALMLACLFGAGLFGAFLISTWAAYARYFAPAFAALSVVGIWLYVDRPTNKLATAIGALACCWLAVAGVRFALSSNLARSSIYGIRDISALTSAGCAALLPVEDAYRRKDIDFVHIGWGYQGAVAAARDYGGRVCPLH